MRLDIVFFKGKIFPASLKKRKYVNLFWPGAMEVPIEGISFIHHDKTFIEILAPWLERKPYLNFAFKKILSSRSWLWIAIEIRVRNLSYYFCDRFNPFSFVNETMSCS